MAGKPSFENRQIAKYLAEVIGRAPRIVAYHHDHLPLTLPIFIAHDQPQEGVVSYSTVGLSDYRNGSEDQNLPRVEITGACDARISEFPNILATAGFCLMRSQWACFPQGALRDAVSPYRVSDTMKHLFMSNPFLWEPGLQTLKLDTKQVAWVFTVPISDEELFFMETAGGEALADRLERKQIDVFDICRPSIM